MDRLAATLALEEPVDRIRQVSSSRAHALTDLGIETVRDLVTHYPRRYVDLSSVHTVRDAVIGQTCTIAGTIHEMKLKKPRPHLSLVEISLVDGTGVLMITCFRQPWLMNQLTEGVRLAVAGKIEFNYGYKRMTNPYLEVLGEASEATGKIIPVHAATSAVQPGLMRRIVENALGAIEGAYDPLPLDLRLKYRLMSRQVAWRCIHFPCAMNEVREAKRRLAYEELLLLELFLMQESRARSVGRRACAHTVSGPRLKRLEAAIPFELTGDQQAAKADLLRVMAAPEAANHMVLGDVGTGKTVVAAFGLAAAADSGGQALFMVPTEVLAHQHAKSLGPLLDAAGISYGVLTGSTDDDERVRLLDAFETGALDVLIGTHALFQDDVKGHHVTLAIIDEQQRFGVNQRARLLSKGEAPDALYLTATPIPRTMALALFGNLSLSYITQRPNDKVTRSTRALARKDRGFAYDAAVAALERGEQVYVVCPLIGTTQNEDDPAIAIDDGDDFDGDNIMAATREAARLQNSVFADWTVELLHGGMASAEKQEVMRRFATGESQVLVATTVIEVGVDVPQATVMIVEDADRFGLAQLHQLRGRVGRGDASAEVFLVSASKQPEALERLRVMESTEDGFELATYDLQSRREGDILGNRQHGASVLKLVNVVRDGALIETAHRDALAIMEEDPALETVAYKPLAREIRHVFRGELATQGG